VSKYDPFEEFEEAYKDKIGKYKDEYTDREVLQLLLRCLDDPYVIEKPLPDAVLNALMAHIMALLDGHESWLLRPADKREHSSEVVIAKATAVVYVENHPDEKKAIAKLYGISTRTLNRWMARYPGGGGEWLDSDIKESAQNYKRGR